jgi:DNA-binding response OmpR family regulator
MRVLVVSEDVNLVKLLEDILARSGYSLDITGGVAEGQDFGESMSYHVILLDDGLPYQELIQFCRNLRRTGSTIPVLILGEKQAESKTVEIGRAHV